MVHIRTASMKNHLIEAVLMSTHNLCFRAKIRKNVYPCTPKFYYTKVGSKGVFVTLTCFRLAYCLFFIDLPSQDNFANILDTGQAVQIAWPDLDPRCLAL